MKRLSLVLLLLSFVLPSLSQTQNLQMDNRMGAGIDDRESLSPATQGRDSTVQDRTVPRDVKMWNIDTTLGEVIPIETDTAIHRFQNLHFTEGINGEYNHLGNLGSPRQSRIFLHRPNEDFIFAAPMDYFLTELDQFHFVDTKSPYTNVTYYRAGNKVNGEERIKGNFAINAGKRFGTGFNLDYNYGRGLYSNQSTALFDAAYYAYWHGDRYSVHALVDYDKLRWAENGGLTDDRYITRPEDMAEGKKSYSAPDMPTLLSKAWNEGRYCKGLLAQHYDFGFYRHTIDSVSVPDSVIDIRTFVPVAKVFHTATVRTNSRRYIEYADHGALYPETFMPYDSIDATQHLHVLNTVGLTLVEGFNRWVPAGASAYLSHEYKTYSLPTLDGEGHESVNTEIEQNLILGGNLRRTLGDALHFNVDAQTVLLGTDLGCFSLGGNGDLNIPLWKDTLQLSFDARMANEAPSYYFCSFHSRYHWWDNDFGNIFSTHLGGRLSLERTHTSIAASIDNLKNYAYLAGFSSTTAPMHTNQSLSSVTAMQYGGNIQVLSAFLDQDFALGILHWDNEICAQYSSRPEVLPLPLVNVYSNLYLKFTYAKVLRIELGGDVRYFTEYKAPAYSPSMGQFYVPDDDHAVMLGNYPFVNVYANFHLKQVRFYVMGSHITQGLFQNTSAFLTPHYPINPRQFKLGLSWNFWD